MIIIMIMVMVMTFIYSGTLRKKLLVTLLSIDVDTALVKGY